MTYPNFAIRTLAAATAILTVACSLPAQTSAQTPANRFIPENSSLVIRLASSAKMRKSFGTTQVAKLTQADSLQPFMQMIEQGIDMNMEMMRESGMFDADLAEGLLHSWEGDIIMSLQVNWEGMVDAINFGEPPPFSFVIALSPDGAFDLNAVATAIEQTIETTSPRADDMRDLVVGDWTLRRTEGGPDRGMPDFTVPAMIDGHLVMVGGTDLEEDAAKLLSREARFGTKTDGAPIYVHGDIGRLISMALESDAQDMPFDPAALLDAIGISALQSLTITLEPDDKAIAGMMHFGMTSEGRGLFDILSKSQQTPKLLQSVPPKSEAFSVSAMDLGALYTTIADVWTMMDDLLPMTFDDAMDMFTEATKVRLKEDLIDHLGSEMLVVQDVDELQQIDPLDMLEDLSLAYAGSIYGISLSDGPAFAQALDTVIRSRGLHVARKTEEYANVKIHRMNLAGLVEIEYAVTNDLILLGIGDSDGSRRVLRDVLDTRASGESTIPNAIATHSLSFPDGWNGIGVTPIGTMLQSIIGGMQAAAAGAPLGDMDMISEVVQATIQDMKRLGINTMVSVSYCDDSGVTARFRW